MDIGTLFILFQFLALGTHWGTIHIIDYQGNLVKGKEYPSVSNDSTIDKAFAPSKDSDGSSHG